jgi:hypothetical protein
MFTFQAKPEKVLGSNTWNLAFEWKGVVHGYKIWPWCEIMEPLCYVSCLIKLPSPFGMSMKYFDCIFACVIAIA